MRFAAQCIKGRLRSKFETISNPYAHTPSSADTWSLLQDIGSLCRFAKFGPMFKTNVLFNPMVVVTDETEVERLLKVKVLQADILSQDLSVMQPAQQACHALPHCVEQSRMLYAVQHTCSQHVHDP